MLRIESLKATPSIRGVVGPLSLSTLLGVNVRVLLDFNSTADILLKALQSSALGGSVLLLASKTCSPQGDVHGDEALLAVRARGDNVRVLSIESLKPRPSIRGVVGPLSLATLLGLDVRALLDLKATADILLKASQSWPKLDGRVPARKRRGTNSWRSKLMSHIECRASDTAGTWRCAQGPPQLGSSHTGKTESTANCAWLCSAV
mmetsp:Transcript_22945/g.60394  ORF Transcript_22945/g.60394 Transcript_22945/m.60394 type:complete len:205 (+) Transcript_22945:719-1333(+)